MRVVQGLSGFQSRLRTILVVAAAGLFLSACAIGPSQKSTESPPKATTQASPEARALTIERAKRQTAEAKLRRSLAEHASATAKLERGVAQLQLKLFERDAELSEINERLKASVLEVVQTKAQLRSVESKAETASHLAEAEIALSELRTESANVDINGRSARVKELLKLSEAEFEKGNYGGSLFLTRQAKDLLQQDRERPISREKQRRLRGEVPFTVPVPLRTKKNSILRDGPSQKHQALATLKRGMSLTGQSYKGRWVRVRVSDGRKGWVHYDLVDLR